MEFQAGEADDVNRGSQLPSCNSDNPQALKIRSFFIRGVPELVSHAACKFIRFTAGTPMCSVTGCNLSLCWEDRVAPGICTLLPFCI